MCKISNQFIKWQIVDCATNECIKSKFKSNPIKPTKPLQVRKVLFQNSEGFI